MIALYYIRHHLYLELLFLPIGSHLDAQHPSTPNYLAIFGSVDDLVDNIFLETLKLTLDGCLPLDCISPTNRCGVGASSVPVVGEAIGASPTCRGGTPSSGRLRSDT